MRRKGTGSRRRGCACTAKRVFSRFLPARKRFPGRLGRTSRSKRARSGNWCSADRDDCILRETLRPREVRRAFAEASDRRASSQWPHRDCTHFLEQRLLAGFHKKLGVFDRSVGQNAVTKIENVPASSERVDGLQRGFSNPLERTQ